MLSAEPLKRQTGTHPSAAVVEWATGWLKRESSVSAECTNKALNLRNILIRKYSCSQAQKHLLARCCMTRFCTLKRMSLKSIMFATFPITLCLCFNPNCVCSLYVLSCLSFPFSFHPSVFSPSVLFSFFSLVCSNAASVLPEDRASLCAQLAQ